MLTRFRRVIAILSANRSQLGWLVRSHNQDIPAAPCDAIPCHAPPSAEPLGPEVNCYLVALELECQRVDMRSGYRAQPLPSIRIDNQTPQVKPIQAALVYRIQPRGSRAVGSSEHDGMPPDPRHTRTRYASRLIDIDRSHCQSYHATEFRIDPVVNHCSQAACASQRTAAEAIAWCGPELLVIRTQELPKLRTAGHEDGTFV